MYNSEFAARHSPSVVFVRKAQGKRISPRREIREQNRIRDGFERRLQRELMVYHRALGQRLEQEYNGTDGTLTPLTRINMEYKGVLERHYRSVIQTFASRAVMAMEKKEEEPLDDPRFEQIMKEFMVAHGASTIRNISNTSRRQIARVVAKGLEEGAGVAEIAKRLSELMSGAFTRVRSATIARTETHAAASFSNHKIAESFGDPSMQKRWVATNDPRTRSHHSQMNGVTVGMDEDFIVPVNGIDYRMAYPSDPRGGAANVINCRCVIAYVAPEDEIV